MTSWHAFGIGCLAGAAVTLILLLAYALCSVSGREADAELPFEGEAERRFADGPTHWRDG